MAVLDVCAVTTAMAHAFSSGRGNPPPLIDRRRDHSWQRRLPGRLGTGALWLGSAGLVGVPKLMGCLLVGSLLVPTLLMLDRKRHGQQPQGRPSNPSLALAAIPLSRPDAAARLGLAESQLFRARHASLCTVHHDAEGRIVALDVHPPVAPIPLLQPSGPHAHPVG